MKALQGFYLLAFLNSANAFTIQELKDNGCYKPVDCDNANAPLSPEGTKMPNWRGNTKYYYKGVLWRPRYDTMYTPQFNDPASAWECLGYCTGSHSTGKGDNDNNPVSLSTPSTCQTESSTEKPKPPSSTEKPIPPSSTEKPVPPTTEKPVPPTTEKPVPPTTEKPVPPTTEKPKPDPKPDDNDEDYVKGRRCGCWASLEPSIKEGRKCKCACPNDEAYKLQKGDHFYRQTKNCSKKQHPKPPIDDDSDKNKPKPPNDNDHNKDEEDHHEKPNDPNRCHGLIKHDIYLQGRIAREGNNCEDQSCTGSNCPPKITDEEIQSAYKDTKGSYVTILQPYDPSFPKIEDNLKTGEELIRNMKNRDALIKSTKVLSSTEVEKIKPNRAENPENVKRVEKLLSRDLFNKFFPIRHKNYTYENFLKAVGAFPYYCRGDVEGKDSDEVCKRLLSASFAHFVQETSAGIPGASLSSVKSSYPDNYNAEAESVWGNKAIDRVYQGLFYLREIGNTEENPGNRYLTDSANYVYMYPTPGNVGFFGRGSKQLSYTANYAMFSDVVFGDQNILLQKPGLVADTWLNFATGIWFAVTPQTPKPSMAACYDGTWTPNSNDKSANRLPGFGATIMIINGGLECNKSSQAATNRVNYYKQFLSEFGLSPMPGEKLDCADMRPFDEHSSGADNVYLERSWGYNEPPQCKLVAYQTPFNALTYGHYHKCVNYNYRSVTVKDGVIVKKNFGAP